MIFNALDKTLKYLDVDKCDMTNTQVESLSNALNTNNILSFKELNIIDNSIIRMTRHV